MPPEDAEVNGLQGLYRRRFDEKERERKNALWKVLCEHFLQRYVDPSDTVLDLGAGYGEFINNIRCAHKYAVDLYDDTASALDEDVTFLKSSASELTDVGDGTADVVFASNLFEHIRSKGVIADDCKGDHSGAARWWQTPPAAAEYQVRVPRVLGRAARVTEERPRFHRYKTKTQCRDSNGYYACTSG